MSALLNRAIKLLAQRDHTENELRYKLAAQSRFGQRRCLQPREPNYDLDSNADLNTSTPEIERVIQYCYAQHWLNDQEYARKFIVMRSEKGYGRQRIKFELQQKGLCSELIATMFQECAIEWQEQAYQVAKRRFGAISSLGWQEKAKIQRFLAARGFTQEEIHAILTKK